MAPSAFVCSAPRAKLLMVKKSLKNPPTESLRAQEVSPKAVEMSNLDTDSSGGQKGQRHKRRRHRITAEDSSSEDDIEVTERLEPWRRSHAAGSESLDVSSIPPSTGIVIPVTKDASSDAKKAMQRATSSGVPARPKGCASRPTSSSNCGKSSQLT
ncbi:hypothetical protein HPB50_005095 [Hyalomma asiaticum]|uniref:Uncharacterized protein n=1 Tax=Hyalomma asiaticum TaxID=266040 RepID=A0ACB7SI87_HYAAI|nr:hypothetical protein HPB50_005095 [Hyalomma asiaticum]